MVTSYIILTLSGVFNILQSASRPLLTLTAIALILVPFPLILIIELYRRGRYHDLMDSSYFLQDGSMRQLRLLITRLPVVPEFPLFRDRYTPISWQKRWNWLNYFFFSLVSMGYRHLLYYSPSLDSLAHDSGVKSLDLFKINCKNQRGRMQFAPTILLLHQW
jgi:hypothetical protein